MPDEPLTAAALSHAAEVWKLIERDRHTSQLALLPEGGVYASGAHCEALRRGPPLDLDHPVAVDGRLLTGALALMPQDKKLAVKVERGQLVIKSGSHRAVLRIAAAEPRTEIDGADAGKMHDLDTLRRALGFLGECAAELGAHNPVLIGIRFQSTKDGLTLSATNGQQYGTARIASAIKAKDERLVPAADLRQALALVGGEARLTFIKEHIVVSDGETVVSMALLNGTWPDTSAFSKITYKHQMAVDADKLERAVQAATLIDEDRLITLAVKGGRASYLIRGQDVGGFRTPAGKTKAPDIEVTMHVAQIAAVLEMGEGTTMRWVDARQPVLFANKTTGDRLWLATVMPPV